MLQLCLQGVTELEVACEHEFKVPNPELEDACRAKPFSLPFGDWCSHWRPRRYRGCVHNELLGITNRHMTGDGLTCLLNDVEWDQDIALGIAQVSGFITPLTDSEVIASTRGLQRKKRLMKGIELYQLHGLEAYHSRLTAFVKVENMNTARIVDGEYTKVKPPRLIQYRHPVYLYRLARWIRPMEHRLTWLKPRGRLLRWFPIPERLIAKGLNVRGAAELVMRIREHFDDPVEVGWDGNRWDSHVSVRALRFEHLVYKAMSSGNKELEKLLSWQLRSKGKTMSGGITYTSTGTRRSGDQNTGIGNSVVNLGLQAMVMRRLGITKWHVIVNGDDCVLFLEKEDYSRYVEGSIPIYEDYGFSSKVGEVGFDGAHVEFCQSRIIDCDDGPRYVRDPWKVLGTGGSIARKLTSKEWIKRMYTIGLLESLINCGVPVLGVYGSVLMQKCKALCPNVKTWWHDIADTGAFFMLSGSGPKLTRAAKVTPAVRRSFAEAFGVSEDYQHYLEQRLAAMIGCWNPFAQVEYLTEDHFRGDWIATDDRPNPLLV